MDLEAKRRMMSEIGREIRRRLPKEFVFALVVAANENCDQFHVWTETDVDPERTAEFLQEALETMRAPDSTRGGN